MYARPQKRKNYSDIAKQAAKQAANASSAKKTGWIPDAVNANGQGETIGSSPASNSSEGSTEDTAVSGLVASLSLTFNGTSSSLDDTGHPFLRPRKRPADKRPFSSMAVCASELKTSVERRSLVGTWSSNSFGSKRMSQQPTSVSSDSKTSSSIVSPLRKWSPQSTEKPTGAANNFSPSKSSTEKTTNTTATSVATSSQQVKGSQDTPNQPEPGASPSKPSQAASSKKSEACFSSSPSPSPSPKTPLSAPTSPSLKMDVGPRTRMDSSRCREIWTLPSRANSDRQMPGLGEDTIVTMPQLVDDHWRKFPVAVRILKGLTEEKMFKDSILDLHFLKRTKVLDISDSLSQRFLIPHNSPIKFGVIYCPGVKNENYFFEKVLDIIQAPDIPKVVTCTRKVKNKDEKSSVNVNEVLIVLDVVRGSHAYSKLPKKPKLKVFSVSDKKEKFLPGDTSGKFTTDPRNAQFYIPEILEYIPNAFPLSARMFLDGDSDHDLPDHLTKNPVTLLHSTIEESVIGTVKDEASHDSGINKKNLSNLIELPVVPDIQVSIISEDQIQLSTIEVLYSDTQTMWKNFVGPPDKISSCTHPAVCGRTPLQNKLTSLCRKGEEAKWCALEAPPLMRKDLAGIQVSTDTNAYQVLIDGTTATSQYTQPIKRQLSSSNSSFDTTRSNSSTTTDESFGGSTDQDLDAFEKIMKSKRDMIKQEPADDHKANMRLIRRVEAVEARVANAAPQTLVNRLTRRVEAMECQPKQKERKASQESKVDKAGIEALKMTIESMQVTIKSLVEELQQVKAQQEELMSAAAKKEAVAEREYEEVKDDKQHNIAILKSMNASQILKLLDHLGFSRYKDVFLEEAITGDILAECTETVLMEDLDIKDSSHCSKLLDIIHGKSISTCLLESIKQSSC